MCIVFHTFYMEEKVNGQNQCLAKSVFFMYIPFESQNQKHDSSVTHVQNFVKLTSFGTINIVEQVDGVYRTKTNAALP